MEARPLRSSLAPLLVAALLGAAPAAADHTVFFYQLDSFEVQGNASAGAGCFEGFDSGLNGWTEVISQVDVAGGFVNFENPGEHREILLPFYDLLLDREDIQSPPSCFLTWGQGDAVLTSEWVNHLPNLPGGFQGHMIVYATPSPGIFEGINVSLGHFDAAVAGELGVPSGLLIGQNLFRMDVTSPGNEVLIEPMQIQTTSITPAALAAATGQRLYLRLSYDEGLGTVAASYSLDGGSSFVSPFTPVPTQFSGAGPALVWATVDPLTALVPSVPALPPAAAIALGLALTFGATAVAGSFASRD
jgi:hypothetical protein